MAGNVLGDIWDGLKQGLASKVQSAEQRITASTGVKPESGNTGAYLGLSIIDSLSGLLRGKADEVQKRILESGTGKSLVSQATKNQVSALVGDWRTWAILGGLMLLFMVLGGAIARSGK